MGPMCWWSSLLLRRNRRSYDWYPGPHGSNILPSRTVREQLAGGITGPAAVTTRRGHRGRGTPIGWGCTVGRNEAWSRAVPAATFAWLCRDHQCGRGVPRPQVAQEARVAEPGDVIQPAVDQFRQGDSHHAVVDLAGVSASEVALRIDDRDVVIQADRPTVTASADDIILAERPSGRFERRLRLPPDVDLSTLTADCTDDVLHLAVGVVNTDGSPAGDQRPVDVGSGQRLASVHASEKKT